MRCRALPLVLGGLFAACGSVGPRAGAAEVLLELDRPPA